MLNRQSNNASARLPESTLTDRLRWLSEARAYASGAVTRSSEPGLLISGLRRSDTSRWEIGVVDARIETDPQDGSPIVVFVFNKPKEEGLTERWLDPEAAFALQAHCFYGGRLTIEAKGPEADYYYLRVVLSVKDNERAYASRLIVGTPSGRFTREAPDHHDMRRRCLGRILTEEERPFDTAFYGRQDMVDWSLARFTEALPLSRDEYASHLSQGYVLLDRLTLGMIHA